MRKIHLIAALLVANCSLSAMAEPLSWLEDHTRAAPKVQRYLQEQNDLTNNYLKQTAALETQLLNDWQSMAPQRADKPWLWINGQQWDLKRVGGAQVLYVKQGDAQKEVYHFAERAAASEYYALGNWSISPDGHKLAFTEDVTGSEMHQLVVVNLTTGQEQIIATQLDTSVSWSSDSQALFVIEKNTTTHKPEQIVRLNLKAKDMTLSHHQSLWFEEKSDWLLSFYPSADKAYLILQSNNASSSEQRLYNLATGKLSQALMKPTEGQEYYADVANNQVWINSNHQGPFSLYKMEFTSLSEFPTSAWQPALKRTGEVNNFYLYQAGIAVTYQSETQSELALFNYAGEAEKTFSLNEHGASAWLSRNGDFNSNILHIRSMSLISPPQWQQVNVEKRVKVTLSQDHYPTFQGEHYVSEKIMVKSGDVNVPVTVAYRRDTLTKSSPVILYGYGAYGFTMKPYFMPQIVSLLDQGAVYAIAHVRGGGYFGEQWHQQGSGIHKPNAIQDFVAVAQAMQSYQNESRNEQRDILALGSSAGGTLVAAAINQAPSLFSAAVLKVPFVDVVNSMSNPNLPLTAQQYSEWGNPHIPSQLSAMKDYDPYLNVSKAEYPALLIQVGLYDQRVPYWEGAKFHAKVKAKSTGQGPYLLQTDFTSGHAMDRRQALQQQAKEYAFLLTRHSSKAEQ